MILIFTKPFTILAFSQDLIRPYQAESWDWLNLAGPLDSPEWLEIAGCWCRCLCPGLLEKVSCLPAATRTANKKNTVRSVRRQTPFLFMKTQ